MRTRWLFLPVLAALMISLPAGSAQEKPKDAPKKKAPISVPAGPIIPKPAPESGKLKKYDDVITKDAVTMPGVFAVHRIDDKIFFEIPADKLGRLMLWQAEVSKGPGGSSFNGMTLSSAVLKFERRGNKIYLWKASFDKRAGDKGTDLSTEAASMDAIIASFPVEAEGKDRTAVIQVSNLFLSGLTDLSVSRAAGFGANVDEGRSYISEVKAFPLNVEVRSMLTFRGGSGGGGFGASARPTSPGASATALIHFSLSILPEQPMMGRYFDPRIGYFTERFDNYADPKTWVVRREFITRFRLEKQDANAAISEPVKPIVFYLGKEVPEKWRSYLKKGVEDWKPAFEKAGFKNAIICRDAPEKSEDPHWDAEDARYSVIRWVAEPIANAMGPHVHDPRSGEIISAHILFWHDVVKLAQMWYFVQCSAQDSRAKKLPLPDDLTGELLRYIAAHEVGHTLGLRHNHRASQAYSIEQLRDPKFTEKHGSVASIMSYGRFNYVAQPEDKVKKLIPVIAPYDLFAIHWGYAPVPGAKTAEDERKTLDEWAARQMKEPLLRFGGEDGPAAVDPTVLTENIGSDAVKATELGLKNLDRVMDHLMAATTTKGEDFDLLKETYTTLLSHRRNWYNAVAKLVGGVVENRVLAGRGGETFGRVPRDKQKEAVKFLLDSAFVTPTKLLNPAVVNQFKYSGSATDVTSQQRQLLQSLLGASRLNRLFDAEVLCPADKCYPVAELVDDLQAGIWSELKAEAPKVDPVRRSLQRAYIDILKGEFDTKASAAPATGSFGEDISGRNPELRAVARTALEKLASDINAAVEKKTDAITKAHLRDCATEIATILEKPRK